MNRWTRQPVKHVADVSVSNVDKKSAQGEIPVRLVNYTDVYYGDRLAPSGDLMEATASRRQVETFRLLPGDVVITKDSESADDIGVAAFIESSASDVVLGYHLALLRPRPGLADGRYLYWAMCSDDLRGQLSTRATGVTRFGLRTDAIGSAVLAVPGVGAQRVIAEFLDAETARIDAVVAQKRLLMQAIRTREQRHIAERTAAALTVALNTSGADVPPGWQAMKLRRCLATVDYGIGEATKESGEIAVLGMTHVNDSGGIDGPVTGFVESVNPSLLLRPGDLLFNRTNSLAKVGKVGLVRAVSAPTTFASYLVRLRTTSLACPQYLNYLLNTQEVLGIARASALPSIGQANLNPSRYSDLWVVLPNVHVQKQCVEELDVERGRVDMVALRLDRQVRLLREHRQALITAAVTGQMEVPGVAA